MEHDKKMVLADSRVLDQIEEKNVNENENLLKKLHSRPVQRKVTSATNLVIERILEDDSVSYDEEIKMYSTALTRYLSATKENEMSWFAPIFGKMFILGENVVISNHPGEEQKIPEEYQITEDKIIRNVPKTYQAKARKLIAHLKDYTGVTWNNNWEMVVDGKSVPDNNITVLGNDILRKARYQIDSVGRKVLIDQLKQTEVPRDIIGRERVGIEGA